MYTRIYIQYWKESSYEFKLDNDNKLNKLPHKYLYTKYEQVVQFALSFGKSPLNL